MKFSAILGAVPLNSWWSSPVGASQLKSYHLESSEPTLCSVSTLIIGSQAGVLFDPPWFTKDGERLAEWAKDLLQDKPLSAIFTTHHHPDHTWSVNQLLEAFPAAKYYSTPQTRHAFVESTADKVRFWKTVVGEGNFPDEPVTPEAFNHTFFTLPGDESSPFVLLSPLIGDAVDHAAFWLPAERILIAGDLVYGKAYPPLMSDVPTLDLAHAWEKALLFMKALKPSITYPGHADPNGPLDGDTDIDFTLEYVRYFIKEVLEAPKQLCVREIYDLLINNFPSATRNASFLTQVTAETFGSDGKVWEENNHEDLTLRKSETLNAWQLPLERNTEPGRDRDEL
ncbi:hypothetical protein MRS44_011973 [Fusarium solani]|uniref:Beta-lactamase-like protein n=1 Tax=Fusarium solani TaxID=169388 RepID=A0A9P9G1P4_FUSSL|nr:beta-lactamase-like protein [Fusarium solani]KAH7230342.1 beta-lactamase-like protein [Fusarium solani]KAJ3461106.1 hypothetical protein MRS44_011973 [Fusarium solani]